jgi:hypothetical protein
MYSPTKPLLQLTEGKEYIPGPGEFVILKSNSNEEVLRHLMSECDDLGTVLATMQGKIWQETLSEELANEK